MFDLRTSKGKANDDYKWGKEGDGLDISGEEWCIVLA